MPVPRVSPDDGASESDKTIALLRRAVLDGDRNADAMTRETALDPLRHCPDFPLLMMDLAFPAEPFAR